MKLKNWVLIILAITFLIACSKKDNRDHIKVQHILISFQGKISKESVTRTQTEAKTLAYKLLKRAKKGENFDKLVEQYTDDSAPGKYKMANTGIEPNKTLGEFSREGMVTAFGDVGFSLKVGEIGIADYDPKTSKYGWHIIKRIK